MYDLTKAIKIVQEGGVVIFPTDTAFAIGCRIDDQKAVSRLFRIRRRPKTQPTPVLVASVNTAEKYWQSPLPNNVRRMTQTYWPGPLTIIYIAKDDSLPYPVRGGGATLGLRMPNHETALALISGVGVPVLGPSANFHGEPTPYAFDQLDPMLVKLADYTLEGECQTGMVSTVVDCTLDPPKVLRQGAVNIKLTDN